MTIIFLNNSVRFGAGVQFYILCGKKKTHLAMHRFNPLSQIHFLGVYLRQKIESDSTACNMSTATAA